MSPVYLETFCFISYLALFAYTWHRLSHGQPLQTLASVLLGVTILGHGWLSYLLIDGGEGQNLGLFNIFCMTSWLAMCLVGWNLLKHKAYPLLLVSLPMAALSILGVVLFETEAQMVLSGKPLNVLHILTGIAAMSILILAALQSGLVLYLDKGLKQHPASIHPWLGSLQGMERFLIHLLTTGFILMSVSLVLVFMLPADASSSQALHKVILTSASWIILGVLMYGRYVRGWRGVFAAKWSLVGVFLLFLGYFGSKLALEVLLA